VVAIVPRQALDGNSPLPAVGACRLAAVPAPFDGKRIPAARARRLPVVAHKAGSHRAGFDHVSARQKGAKQHDQHDQADYQFNPRPQSGAAKTILDRFGVSRSHRKKHRCQLKPQPPTSASTNLKSRASVR
jgi:hypothetical protein